VHRNIISIVKPTRFTNVSNLFYFGMTLYMFLTVFPSIMKSSRQYIQQQVFVKETLLSAWLLASQQSSSICFTHACCWMHNLELLELDAPTYQIYFILEMTIYMFRTVFPSIIRSSKLYIQQQAFVIQILLSAWLLASQQSSSICLTYACCCITVLNSWWWTKRPSGTCRLSFQNKINLIRWCI